MIGLMTESILTRAVAWTRRLAPLHREIALLVVLSVAAVGVFLGTRALASSNASLRRRDSVLWLTRGRDALQRGDVAGAVLALRRAAEADRMNDAVDAVLASALEQAGDAAAAEAVLLDRRSRTVDDPEVNIALARLEARRGRVADAVRYYQTALDTLWSGDREQISSRLRQELIELLLASHQRGPALAQVLVLAAAMPGDPASQVAIGRLFLQAGDPRRALERFASALAADPRSHDALSGAGESAFALRDYARARKFLVAAGTLDAAGRRQRDLAAMVVDADPLAARLLRAERVRRLKRLLQLAGTALASCESDSPEADSVRRAVAVADVTRPVPQADERDQLEDGVVLASRAARVAAGCGAPASAIDAAPLISALHDLDEPQ
jgi:tetratricopeptide (TPR) repeat protein